ncbi:MAG: hypothetical protein V3W41_02430 [Planctomycetota bacterium]
MIRVDVAHGDHAGAVVDAEVVERNERIDVLPCDVGRIKPKRYLDEHVDVNRIDEHHADEGAGRKARPRRPHRADVEKDVEVVVDANAPQSTDVVAAGSVDCIGEIRQHFLQAIFGGVHGVEALPGR